MTSSFLIHAWLITHREKRKNPPGTKTEPQTSWYQTWLWGEGRSRETKPSSPVRPLTLHLLPGVCHQQLNTHRHTSACRETSIGTEAAEDRDHTGFQHAAVRPFARYRETRTHLPSWKTAMCQEQCTENEFSGGCLSRKIRFFVTGADKGCLNFRKLTWKNVLGFYNGVKMHMQFLKSNIWSSLLVTSLYFIPRVKSVLLNIYPIRLFCSETNWGARGQHDAMFQHHLWDQGVLHEQRLDVLTALTVYL